MSADRIRQIFIEQTSPLEMIVFMFLVVVACLFVAAVFYAVLMSVVWALSLRHSGVGFRQLFLPSADQLRDYAPEYVLTSGTSILLAYTTVARHALVQRVKGLDAADVEGIGGLFSPTDIPGADALADALAGLSLTEVIQPALKSGRSEEVKAILVGVIDGSENLAFDPRMVFIGAAILVLAHLLWLAQRRTKYLAANPDRTGTLNYGKTSKSIRVLAVCVALLLAAPTMAADSERLADSAMAAIESTELPADAVPVEIIEAILAGSSVATVAARVTEAEAVDREIESRLADAETLLRGVDDRLGGIDDSLAETAANLAEHTRLIAALDSRFGSLESTMGAVGPRLDGLESQLGSVDTRVGDLNTRLGDFGTRLGDLDTRLGGLDGRLDGYDNRFTRIEGSAQDAIDQIGSQARFVAGLDTRLGTAEANIGAFGSRLGDVEAGVDGFDSRLATTEAGVATLGTRLGGFDTRFRQIDADLQGVTRDLRAQDGLLAGLEEGLRAMQTDIQRNARQHSTGGYLIVSGVAGAGFSVQGQGSYTVPAIVPLPAGNYTLVPYRGEGFDETGSVSRDAGLTLAIDPQQPATLRQQTAVQQIRVLATVRADRATGVTLPWVR